MSVVVNKRSIMTLFGEKNDLYSHQVRIVLAEKDIPFENKIIEPNTIDESLMELNPYGSIPTLVEREIVVFIPRIIMEFLDERYPHPSLMPVYPVARAQSRIISYRIIQDWFSLYEIMVNGSEAEQDNAAQQLKQELLAITSTFAQTNYFMSEEFSFLDCYIAPLLWQLRIRNVDFNEASAKPIKAYMRRVFARPSFKSSILDQKVEHLLEV